MIQKVQECSFFPIPHLRHYGTMMTNVAAKIQCTLYVAFFLLREIDRKIGRPRRRKPDFSTAKMRRRNGEKSFASICPRGEKVLLLADEQVICKAKKGNLTGIENVLQ